MKYSVLFVVSLFIFGCSSTYQNRNPKNEIFPNVSGESLAKESVTIPQFFNQEKTILLLGYVQNSQFDIDRWLIGLDMTGTTLPVYEIPTIAGLFPQFFETQINNGMRAGIPKELWKGVITVFEGGEKVQKFTGNENPNNARVLLIDASGKVLFFHDEGFSVGALKKLRAEVEVDSFQK
ncbi:hypothetical protein [Pleionea sediminis]|uniref:hypothetical protein n=1 Tax=Pleionea sediminis TaxID=2569479 RepID=UPI001184791E|nr:hypothetical protein [Pleionea sediminis]